MTGSFGKLVEGLQGLRAGRRRHAGRQRGHGALLLGAGVLAACACAARGEAGDWGFVERVRADAVWIAGPQSRLVGSAGHERVVKEFRARLAGIGGVRVWTQEFPVVVPTTRQAVLTVSAGAVKGPHPVYPLWPCSVRPHTTPPEGITGALVYVGRAGLEEMPARSLRGQIAVMEMTGGANWANAFNFGARAVILLGSEAAGQGDAEAHLTRLPLDLPRFYVPPGPLAEALRNRQAPAGTLLVRAGWTEATATNVWVLVKPPPPAQPRQALAVAAQLDAMSVVPAFAPGADAAVDAAVVLNLIRHYAAHPPPRPVVFMLLDAHGFNQRGLREMLVALATEDRETRTFREEDAERVEEYRRHAALAAEAAARAPAGLRPDEPLPFRAALTESRYRPLYRYVKDEVDREVIAIEQRLHPLRLRLYSTTGPEDEGLKARIADFEARRAEFFAAQRALLAEAQVSGEVLDLAGGLWERAVARIRRQLAEARAELDVHAARRRLRDELLAELHLTGHTQRPLEFLLGIDLSDAGVAAGPLAYCRYWLTNEIKNSSAFRDWLSNLARTEAGSVWPGALRRAVDLNPVTRTDSPDSYAVGETATLTGLAGSFGTAGATWTTLDAARDRVDTPLDRFDRLDWDRLAPQIEATRRLIDRLVGGGDFAAPAKVVHRWNRVDGVIVDESPGEPVPRLPMGGYLTTLEHGSVRDGRAFLRSVPQVPGIRRQEFRFTGADGRSRFDALPAQTSRCLYFVQSYLLDEAGRIVRALDLRKSGRGVRLGGWINSADLTPLRAVPFTCGEISGVQFFDPRFLQDLPNGTVLDARRGGVPQQLNFTLDDGQMACQLEPGIRWELVLRSGIARNRLALLNVQDPLSPAAGAGPPPSAGAELRHLIRGFPVGEPLPAHPMQIAAADMCRLDRRRLDDYAAAGITSAPIARLQERTESLLAEADEALAADDGAAFFRAAGAALAGEVRAYQATRDLAADVVRGAIFLLLMLIPFAYALERLLLGSPRIYRQLAAILVIFAVMAAVLWSFHPAFRISSQPMMIVMAFGIIAMSLLVLSVVYRKFESGLAELRTGRAEASGAQTSRMGVLVTAVRLGIANMRKRRLRTALTGAAVVLITFALMCFTSASSYRGTRRLRLSAKPPHAGVLVRQPGRRPMPPAARTFLENAVGHGREVAARLWWCSPAEPNWRVHVRNADTGRQVSLLAGLGLSPAEARLTGLDAVCPDWPRFVAGGGCYLPAPAAETLKVSPGRHVIVAGRRLEVIGTFDPRALDQRAVDLDGGPLLPTDYGGLSDAQRSQSETTRLDILTAQVESGRGLADDPDLPTLSGKSVIILPERMLRPLPHTSLRSLAVAADGAKEAEDLAMELTARLAFPIYYGSPAGARAVVSTPMLPSAPKGLLIPLLIGGLMIFNTMLSSIAERRRDVYIYTSVGLAPLHVAVLFLAEAVTYGLMGSVFGYIAGQGAATVLSGLGWMGGLTLNYSGTQAVAVMLMVLAVVVLSSLVPAYLAGRLAAPSSQRTWKVPDPDGEVIRDTLPFTVSAHSAAGVLMFLHEYLDAHREGSIGHFSTDDLRTERRRVGDLEALDVRCTVWLAPYDLGVRQDARLSVRPTDLAGVYAVAVELRHGAGQMRSWKSLNRTFLGDLRRQLLGWRRLKARRVLEYIAQGREMIGSEKRPVKESHRGTEGTENSYV